VDVPASRWCNPVKTLHVKSTHNPAIVVTPTGAKIICGGTIVEVNGEGWDKAYIRIEGDFTRANLEWEPARGAVIDVRPSVEKIYNVTSSDGMTNYEVRNRDGVWSCTCDGFHYRRTCRHIKEIE
jgi:hypothetical protein